MKCEEGDVRVAGGTASGGHVEMCIDEVWSSLCAQQWTALNTEVVCRQLEYDSSGAVFTYMVFWNLITHKINYYNLQHTNSCNLVYPQQS